MLPFLKPKDKAQAGIVTSVRKPDEQHDEPRESEEIETAAKDILNAINSNDHRRLAIALRAAFDLLDSEPHYEGEHIESSEE